MPKGVYDRKRRLTKKEKKKRRQAMFKKMAAETKSLNVEEIRSLPTLDRNSVHVGFEGDFSLGIDVRVGPRLNEERHGFNWRYWHND